MSYAKSYWILNYYNFSYMHIFFNLTTSDQYLSIVVPGRMFEENYKDKGLAPENLSRTLEDSGTVTSVLIPWNTCGAYSQYSM